MFTCCDLEYYAFQNEIKHLKKAIIFDDSNTTHICVNFWQLFHSFHDILTRIKTNWVAQQTFSLVFKCEPKCLSPILPLEYSSGQPDREEFQDLKRQSWPTRSKHSKLPPAQGIVVYSTSLLSVITTGQSHLISFATFCGALESCFNKGSPYNWLHLKRITL